MSTTFQFRPPYQLSGESGKGIGAGRRSLADLGVVAASLSLLSQGTDTLRLTIEGRSAPDYLQQVSCWDADGRRVFTGVATEVDEQWDGQKTRTVATISGPWWWLEQVQLTSIVQDSLSNAQERAIYTFPSQDLAVSIRALLGRLEEMGVPLTAGQIDTTFQVPQMQFQNGTGESILTTMLQWLPDAATCVRYDVGGLPRLDILRRPSAPIINLDLAAAPNRAGIPQIVEQRSLVPNQVRVQTMEVNASGQIVYGEDVAGDENPGSPIGRQFLSLSGPGRGDFEAYTPRVATLRTETVPSTYSGVWALALTFDTVINSVGTVTWAGYGNYGGFPTLSNVIQGTGVFRLVEGQLVDFLLTEFSISETQTKIAGWVKGLYPSGGWSSATQDLIDMGRARALYTGGYYQQAVYVDFTVPALNNSYPSLTVFVHPEDQALVSPVPSLAANLYAAQNYTPVSGNVPLWPGAPLALPGHRLNIRGGLPKWSTMGAMTSGLSLDLATGSADCQLGRASRASSASVLNQFSRPLSGRIVRA